MDPAPKTILEKLKERKQLLQSDIQVIDEGIEILERNQGVAKAIEAIAKLG